MGRKKPPVVPKGKHSAGRRGFYSEALDEAEQLDLELARDVEGIDDEIAVLRVKIKSLLDRDPDNIRLIMEATNTLARLVSTRFRITGEQKKSLTEAIANVLKGIAVPLGMKIIQN